MTLIPKVSHCGEAGGVYETCSWTSRITMDYGLRVFTLVARNNHACICKVAWSCLCLSVALSFRSSRPITLKVQNTGICPESPVGLGSYFFRYTIELSALEF